VQVGNRVVRAAILDQLLELALERCMLFAQHEHLPLQSEIAALPRWCGSFSRASTLA
jgi:hypothetical protein